MEEAYRSVERAAVADKVLRRMDWVTSGGGRAGLARNSGYVMTGGRSDMSRRCGYDKL